MKCYKCGCSLPEDSEFCQYCGNKLETYQLNDADDPIIHENKAEKSKKANLSKSKKLSVRVANKEPAVAPEQPLVSREKTRRNGKFKIIAFIAVPIAIISLVLNIVQYNSVSKLTAEKESLDASVSLLTVEKESRDALIEEQEENIQELRKERIVQESNLRTGSLERSRLQSLLWKAEADLSWYHESIALVNNYNGGCAYHTISCDKLAETFYVKNDRAAESLGCWPCPDCHTT